MDSKKLINVDDDIYIENFINKVNTLGNENNKTLFIENYNNIKNQISNIDIILDKNSTIDNNLDIKTLFEMLNKYTDTINEDDIKITDYKNILDLVNLIENKIKNENINIKEIN